MRPFRRTRPRPSHPHVRQVIADEIQPGDVIVHNDRVTEVVAATADGHGQVRLGLATGDAPVLPARHIVRVYSPAA